MELPIYQVDAFTGSLFAGNPAAVVPLDAWLDDDLMQAIAAENNLSETAFVVPEGDRHRIRWFTPAVEVDLCGHATLATAAILFGRAMIEGDALRLDSRSGELTVTRDGDLLALDFPADPPRPADPPAGLFDALGREPTELLAGRVYFAVYDSQADIEALAPDLPRLAEVDMHSICCTAPGDGCDFVSRYFAPAVGIPEDPVTGSAHCLLTPYWAQRLGKTELHARQISARGGELFCRLDGDRVRIAGRAVEYLAGTIRIP